MLPDLVMHDLVPVQHGQHKVPRRTTTVSHEEQSVDLLLVCNDKRKYSTSRTSVHLTFE